MGKELGQIHAFSTQIGVALANQNTAHARVDFAAELTGKLQRMIRQGQYFKLVGIDMSISPDTTAPADGGSVTGYIRYFNPTKGRCAAYRHAFKSMAEQMELAGIPMRDNAFYDFRCALTPDTTVIPALENQATLDGVTGLSLTDPAGLHPGASVFGVYNKSVLPTGANIPAGDLYDEGFDTLIQSGPGKTDFVLNDNRVYSGDEDYASESFSIIPFQLSFAPGSRGTTFQWRPDPALYVAVLAGAVELFIQDVDLDGATTSVDLDVNWMISGWKSIMGNPKK